MRKRIGLLLTLLLLFSLAACGSRMVASPEKTDTVSTATQETEDEPAVQTPADEPASFADSTALVAYFSRAGENYSVGVVEKGNTEIIAEMIAQATGAETFHIETAKSYPEGYEDCKKVVMQERDEGARPELASGVDNFAEYDVIYLGYPIWYGDMPMAVYTFLESCDFTGKTVIPFCTHGGSGLAGTVGSIRAVCGATVLDGLAIAGAAAQNDRETAQELVLEFLKAN